MFGLSVAQAAATLAATFVGLQIGLFTTSTVNAVMIVIVVSLILASVSRHALRRADAEAGRRHDAHRPDGRRPRRRRRRRPAPCSPSPRRSPAPTSASCDRRTSWPTARTAPARSSREHVEREITRLALDAELEVRHDRSVTDGLLHTAELAPRLADRRAGRRPVVAPRPPRRRPARARRRLRGRRWRSCGPARGTARRRVVLALADRSQAKRPSSAGLLAAMVAVRFGATGYRARGRRRRRAARGPRRDPRPRRPRSSSRPPQAWLAEHGRPTDSSSCPAVATARWPRRASPSRRR